MASEQSTERIIDLIYGELPEEEEEQMRRELADSAELRAELDSYEDLLGELRSALPAEEPSPSVHASILDAARTAAETQSDRRAARRVPDGGPRMGIWGRLSSSNIAQFATVAAVLLAGVFVVKFVDRGGDPTMAPASDISAAREPAPAMKRPAPEEATAAATPTPADEPVGGEVAKGELAEAGDRGFASRRDGVEQAKAEEAAKEITAMAAEEEARAASSAGRSKDDQKTTTKRRRARRAPASRTAKKKANKPKPKPEPEPDLDSAPRRPADKVDALEKSLDSDAVDLFDGDESGYGTSEAQNQAPPTAKGKAAEAEAPRQQEAKQYRAETGTISAVEQQWRSRDYGGTVRAADEFLQSGRGSNTDKARAMHLKAQAYMQQGRYSQAERLFATIQKNYPSYMTSQINQGRAEAKSKLQKKPRRKSRSKPAKSFDDSILEADEAAPSAVE